MCMHMCKNTSTYQIFLFKEHKLFRLYSTWNAFPKAAPSAATFILKGHSTESTDLYALQIVYVSLGNKKPFLCVCLHAEYIYVYKYI